VEDETFEKISSIPCTGDQLDAWHRKPGAFERLSPPWEHVAVVEASEIENAGRTTLRVKTGPFWRRWIAEYRSVEEGVEFTDVQISGPMAAWRHRHRFLAKGQGKEECSLIDEIAFRPPLGFVGKFLLARWIRKKVERVFTYRHELTASDIARESARQPAAPMNILITGASGLLGQALIPYLRMRGHTILKLTRTPSANDEIGWDPGKRQLDLSLAGDIDAVVHLAGENVAGGRWNKKRRDRIFYSRKDGTRLLADTLAAMPNPPRVLVSASGINYYEQNAVNTHDESSPLGTGFLSEVCREWELATRPAEDAGIRVVKLRIGMVLSPAGGALKKMLPAFKSGFGGKIGSGKQRVSWIGIDDVVDMIARSLSDDAWHGPVNAVAAAPLSNAEFTKALARALRRPSILPVPAFAVRLLFGKMVDETLLADLPVYSTRLAELGYELRHPDLDGALRHLLGAYTRDSPTIAHIPVITQPPALPLPATKTGNESL
jgi:uncharacterized protein (TIGR01777 family)